MLIQTKDAADTLRSLGLKRTDFRVRCERIMRGKTFVGYGDVSICLLCSMEKQYGLMEALAKHFKVIAYRIDGAYCGGLHVQEAYGKPELKIRELSKEK